MLHYKELKDRIQSDRAHIVIMGLGYVGLPLAAELAKTGAQVTGYDPDKQKVDSVNEGVSYVDYPSSEVLTYLKGHARLSATTDPTVLRSADVVVICVPTPLSKTKEPDLSMVQSAIDLIAQYQHAGMLVILESTTYPGTTREMLVPQLTKGLNVLGSNIFIGYSPERIDPGNPRYNLTNTPKIVSGLTAHCLDLTYRFYRKVNEVAVRVSKPEIAEMAKVLENTFRAVNIGLANEVALLCRKLSIDPFEVISAAATKPFGFMPFYPGPGLGGHCIPVDPLYLSWKMRSFQSTARFIELADAINSGMPDYVVSLVSEALNAHSKAVRGSSVLVMGVSYKADVSDTRESPAIPIIEKLRALGAKVSYQDPWVEKSELLAHHGLDVEECESAPHLYEDFDVTLILASHTLFDFKRVLGEANLIVDTRGVYTEETTAKHIFRL